MHYMFAPEAPVAVEMYMNREHFSVRTSGLPNIGIEGVCFGHVVAAMSPKSEPFNWGNVLWHELAHVFAIQLSKYHVPRWFTEGLSEYETMIRRPEWHRELDPELYLALRRKSLPGALGMNTAFTHADGDLDVTVAYYAASQMLAFTAEQFGFPRITRALEAWGEGRVDGGGHRRRVRHLARRVRPAVPGVGDGAPLAVRRAVHVRRAGGGARGCARRGRRGPGQRQRARGVCARPPPGEEARRGEARDRRGAAPRRREQGRPVHGVQARRPRTGRRRRGGPPAGHPRGRGRRIHRRDGARRRGRRAP